MTDGSSRPGARGHAVGWSLVAGALIALTIAVFAWTGAPNPPSLGTPRFQGTVDTPPDCTGPCPSTRPVFEDIPPDVRVTVHWIDVSAGAVQFSIWTPYLGQPVCDQIGSSGLCTFSSLYPGGNYTFEAGILNDEYGQQVNFTGYYD